MTTTEYTAEELREQGRQAAQRATESWERCDTDGFMSQWAGNLTAALREVQAEIVEAGGTSTFTALFDLDGNHVPAREVQTQYGWAWGLLDPADPDGRFIGWFNPSKAHNEATARRNNAAKGFYVGTIRAAAWATLQGANCVSVQPVIYRKDRNGPFEIVDNGH